MQWIIAHLDPTPWQRDPAWYSLQLHTGQVDLLSPKTGDQAAASAVQNSANTPDLSYIPNIAS